ncbi:M1 family metallopeptidase [Bacillus sp. 1P06AnD]|uniref:M1 family metallopeptidase n=1 Tax=Bacillus sp. 1P06AnD TaxID=3132208 RepID=UPI0039A284BA
MIGMLIAITISIWQIGRNGIKENENPDTPTRKEVNHFSPENVNPGSEAKYEITLDMDQKNIFKARSTTYIKNISVDKWSKLVFYFIPNMFTKENSPQLKNPSTVKMESIKLNGKTATFTLEKDTISVLLKEALLPNSTIKVEIQYAFTLPKEGLRFNKNEKNYFLAQWYPMVATYRDHKWNKEEYRFKGETYHTSYSRFKIKYKLNNDLSLISSSDNETLPVKREGILYGENIKEFFIALLEHPNVIEKKVDETTIRVFGVDESANLHKEISEVASKAFVYFQDIIGPYPYKQLDIVLDEMGMEYPGIVTAHSIYNGRPLNSEALKRIIVHEIAHQWFYGMISNDPFNDAWLDEGLAEFSKELFYANVKKKEIHVNDYQKGLLKELPLPVNLPLDQYGATAQSSYIYGKSVIFLTKIFQDHGGRKKAEAFLKAYYDHYRYKEVNTKEFSRFLTYFLHLKNTAYYKDWLSVDE